MAPFELVVAFGCGAFVGAHSMWVYRSIREDRHHDEVYRLGPATMSPARKRAIRKARSNGR